MDKVKAKAIILEYFTKPDFDRLSFLIEQEKASNRPPEVFARWILNAYEDYCDKLNNEMLLRRAWGNNDITDFGLPMLNETGGRFEGHLYLSQMPIYLEGIKEYIANRVTPPIQPAIKQDKDPRDNHHVRALYLFYTGVKVTEADHERSIFNKWTDWRKESNRINANIVKFKTQLKHLETVRDWLRSEGRRDKANQCQKDIDTLKANCNKM